MIEPSQEPILDELNPTAQETEIELQEFPDPELVPTSEVELNASEPLPEFQPAMDEPAVETIDWSYLTVPKLNNYVPRESSIPETDTEGSVFMASFERENSIGSFLNRGSSRDPSKVDTSVFNVVEHLNPDQMPDLYHYAFDMSQDDINETSARLQRERKNQAILDAHPWQAFGAGFITSGVLDPINYLPFGAVYNRARKAASVGKVFGQGALAGIASTTTQEAALHNTQLTRSVEESIWNVTVSSILGGALGAGTAMASKELKMPKEQAKFAYDQIMESIIDPYKGPRGSAGAMARHVREESLADLPQWVKSSMKLSPLSRLASSDYKTANRFANDFLQNGFITRGNLEGETGGGSVETLTNLRLRQSYNHIVEYQDAYLRMLGIESGPAKKIRSLVTTKPEMSSAEFGDRVSRSLFLDTTDDNAFVRDGVNSLKPVFESYKKELVELGKLENIEGTKTSAGYIPIMKNKKLILEQGGRDAKGPGTYPQAVFEGFQRSRDAAKEFSETPFYKEKQQEISLIQDEIKGHPERLERGRIEQDAKDIKGLLGVMRSDLKTKEQTHKISTKKATKTISASIKESENSHNKHLKDAQAALSKTKELNQKLKTEQTRLKLHKPDSVNHNKALARIEKVTEEIEISKNKAKEFKNKAAELQTKLRQLKDELKKAKELPEDAKKSIDILYNEIFNAEKMLKHLEETKVKDKTKNETGKLEDRISEIKREIAENAPKYTIDDEGNLFPFDMNDEVLWAKTEQHVDRILGHQEDLLLNPFIEAFNRPNSLMDRTLLIDQEALHAWHIKDPVTLVTSYVRGLAPLIELEKKAQSLGFKDFSEMRTQISRDLHSEFISKSEGKTGRAITKEDAKLKSLSKDINASLDIIQGIYQQGSNVMSTKPAKFFENFRAYNALRMLGGITISSLPDIGRIAMQNGVFNTIFHGLIPMVKGANKISKQDIRALGYSIESELGMRINMFMDQETLSTNPGFMTKTFSTLSQGFGDLTLFNQWTSLTERVAGNLSINDTLSTIHNIVAGKKVSKRSRTRLAQLGIEDTYFEYIAEQTSKPDNISTNNTRVADWTSWDVRNEFEAEALRQYQAAIAKDIEVTLNYPNAGDIPLVGHSVAGRLLLQFKTFMFSVTNKTLITGIQRRKDVETYTGIVSMLGLGALGYVLSSYSKGKEPDMSFQNLAKEAIDRSGMLGVLMEAVDIGHALNILPGTGVSRYQTRGVLGAVLGPTYGTVADILPMIYKAGAVAKGNEEFTTKDVKSLTRLLPFQNIFYMNWLSDQLVTETGNTFNLIENREGY